MLELTKKYFILFFCLILLSCEHPNNIITSDKTNKFPIQFLKNEILKTHDGIDTFQIYALSNVSKNTIYVKTVKNENVFENKLIKKIYERDYCLKHKNSSEWSCGIESNAHGYYSIDSIALNSNESILFVMRNIEYNLLDSILYNIKIKIKHGSTYKDTLVRKKLRLYNNEKFVEDMVYWPAIEDVLNQRH